MLWLYYLVRIYKYLMMTIVINRTTLDRKSLGAPRVVDSVVESAEVVEIVEVEVVVVVTPS